MIPCQFTSTCPGAVLLLGGSRVRASQQPPALLVQNAATVEWGHLGRTSPAPGPSLLACGSSGSGSFSVAMEFQGACAAPAVLSSQGEVWVWSWQGQGVTGQWDRSAGWCYL